MCPDPGLISSWVDGEVPSPWKERLQSHLEVCPSCAAKAAAYRGLSVSLGPDGSEDMAVARIEERLRGRLAPRLGPESLSHDDPAPAPVRLSTASPLWRRGLVLPMPLVAAAAAALVFLVGLAASNLMGHSKPAVQSLATTEMAPQTGNSASMEALVHYLEAQNAQVNLTIQLPSGATFSPSGKPMVVKAAEANFQAQDGPVQEIAP